MAKLVLLLLDDYSYAHLSQYPLLFLLLETYHGMRQQDYHSTQNEAIVLNQDYAHEKIAHLVLYFSLA